MTGETELRKDVAEEIHALDVDWEHANQITDCIFQSYWVYDKNKVRDLLYRVEGRLDDYFVEEANSAERAGYPEAADVLIHKNVEIQEMIKEVFREVFGEVDS